LRKNPAKFELFDYNTKDPSNNLSYEEGGQSKISADILVPDYLVSLIIGKNGECIRSIMNKTSTLITFSKEVIIIHNNILITNN